ncbi:MAG: cyclase family protein [Clostridia bacterium]|jgi:arylformamidase
MQIKRIIDVSATIKPDMALWPDDGGLKISRRTLISEGGACNLSSISFSLHTGTHADAPFHFYDEGRDIASLDLSRFIGFVKVFDLGNVNNISRSDIEKLGIEKGDTVFLKTSNSFINEALPFTEEYIALDVSAAWYLANTGIKCVGVDYLSIDEYNKGHHDVHMVLLSKEIGIIEGLNLRDVEPGTYFFSALPLKIENADGSPIRAVLVEFEESGEKK